MRIVFILFILAQVCSLEALTVDDFAKLGQSEKIEILRGRPDRLIDDPKATLSLYSSALSDESTEVRLVAAQASVLLMAGIQSAPDSGIPEFYLDDTVVIQHRLVELINDENPSIRMAASEALAYSSSPNNQIEELLLNRVKKEPVDEVKISTLTAMAVAGYESAKISDRSLRIFKSTQDSLVRNRSIKLIGFLNDDRLLPELISIVKGKDLSLAKGALLAISSYGRSGKAAKPHLLEIINNPESDPEVINLARVAIDAIDSVVQQNPGIRAMKTRELWPVTLPDHSNGLTSSSPTSEVPATPPAPDVEEVAQESSAPEPATEKPAEVKTPDTSEEPIKQSSNWWLWLIGAVVVVGGLALVLRRKS